MQVAGWQALDNHEAQLAWAALAECASEPNPFHEHWYLLPALRALNPGGSVKLLRFEIGGDLAGLLPLRRAGHYYRWPIPHLTTWLHGNAFLGAPLVGHGLEYPFWHALLDWADRAAGPSLFLHLPEMPLEGPLYTALSAICTEQGRQIALVHHEERAMLQSQQSPTGYFEASLSGKKRKELRRQHARLSELGQLSFERCISRDGLAEWTEAFLTLERSGWKGSAGSALASHHATTDMFRSALAGAATQRRLERLTLCLDGEPIAMLVQFLTPPGSYSYKTAFDERYARFSPGVLLQRENLALLENHEIAWCDSCAAADHPMIDHIWRERRLIGRLSVAIGGRWRRAMFSRLVRAELRRSPADLPQPVPAAG